jgi:YidC/Oxa1 family membrane protein insertase
MTTTTFLTQRQMIVKNTASDNPVVRQQKILLYVFPLVFAIGGINFPIGVLIYWFTTNLWSMGQQFWVIRNNPQPGTPAYEAREARKAQKAKAKAAKSITVDQALGDESEATEESTPARVQPKKTPRSKRKGTS